MLIELLLLVKDTNGKGQMNSLNITIGEREQRVLNAAIMGFVLNVVQYFAAGADKETYWVSIDTANAVADALGLTLTAGNAVLKEILNMVWSDLCAGSDPFDPDYDCDTGTFVRAAAPRVVTMSSFASELPVKVKFL